MILNGASHASYLSIHGIWRAANVTLFSPLYLFVCLSLALTDDDNYKGMICAKKSMPCLIIVILTFCIISQNRVWKQQMDRWTNTNCFFLPSSLSNEGWPDLRLVRGSEQNSQFRPFPSQRKSKCHSHHTQTLSGAQFTGALIIKCFSLLSRISPGSRVSIAPSFLGVFSDVLTAFDKTIGGFRESCNWKKKKQYVCAHLPGAKTVGASLNSTKTHKNILDHTWFLSLHQIVGLGKMHFSSNHNLHLNNWTI